MERVEVGTQSCSTVVLAAILSVACCCARTYLKLTCKFVPNPRESYVKLVSHDKNLSRLSQRQPVHFGAIKRVTTLSSVKQGFACCLVSEENREKSSKMGFLERMNKLNFLCAFGVITISK